MKFIDEYHTTSFNFEIDFTNAKKVPQYLQVEVFTISFCGLGIFFRWIIANIVAVLKVIFQFDSYRYIPMSHIEAVGISVEFYRNYTEAQVYMVNWENGRKYYRACKWVDLDERKNITGMLSIDQEDGSYYSTIGSVGTSRDFEHTYTLVDISQNDTFLKHLKQN